MLVTEAELRRERAGREKELADKKEKWQTAQKALKAGRKSNQPPRLARQKLFQKFLCPGFQFSGYKCPECKGYHLTGQPIRDENYNSTVWMDDFDPRKKDN